MSIAEQLFSYVEKLQADADSSFDLYPKHQCVLPNDAIYLLRAQNLRSVCQLVEEMVNKSGKQLNEVISLAIVPNRGEILKTYQHVGDALDAIIERYRK